MLKHVGMVSVALSFLAIGAMGASAQDFGGGYDYGDYFGSRPTWYSSLQAAISSISTSGSTAATTTTTTTPGPFGRRRTRFAKKYVFVYVQAVTATKDHNIFKNSDLVSASRGRWAHATYNG